MLQITNTKPHHASQLAKITYCEYENEDISQLFQEHQVLRHIERFPQGQFVALINGKVVGYAVTMRTGRSPEAKPLPWLDAIGDMTLRAHNPRGKWLYGVDFYVHHDYRKRGIGSALYRARFDLVKRLGLNGFYAGGMLMGYPDYYHKMSVQEYAQQVTSGHIKDPTITMQMNRGFRPEGVIHNYMEGDPLYTCAMLIVWDNPTLKPARLQAASA
ncbi:MAG: GNAT family N-acetyltransferase [Phototrophicales bacterium]|nr:MAG: GNAT family N-acetyltransferase [Phototrophicales bacterium]RMG72665.1 MAG: N-acetyltransferase [Chloroflexota bacterium]